MPEIIRQGKTGSLVSTTEEAVEAIDRIPEIDRMACRTDAGRRSQVECMVDDLI